MPETPENMLVRVKSASLLLQKTLVSSRLMGGSLLRRFHRDMFKPHWKG
jgi:hypothetical protein